jgi:hypothetical protein
MIEFIVNHWSGLLIALLALAKVIVNLTPTTVDNKVFGWIDVLINAIVADRRKKKEIEKIEEKKEKERKKNS